MAGQSEGLKELLAAGMALGDKTFQELTKEEAGVAMRGMLYHSFGRYVSKNAPIVGILSALGKQITDGPEG